MISFSEFLLTSKDKSMSENLLPKISPTHNSKINPNPDLQRVLNLAAKNTQISAQQLASLSKSVFTQASLTARRIKSLTPAQQTEIMFEMLAITSALSRLFALYVQNETLDAK